MNERGKSRFLNRNKRDLGMTDARFVQLPAVFRGRFLVLGGRCVVAFVSAVLIPVLLAQAAAPQEAATNQAGKALYKQRCAACHQGTVPRAPNRAVLKQMSPESIRFALVGGSMAVQGLGLTTQQIADLAEFLTGRLPMKEQVPAAAMCAADAGRTFSDPLAKPHWSGWGVNLEQHRFQPAEMAQLTAEQVPKLKLKWAFGFPGVFRAQAQATVAGGRVFVGSFERRVYSLSAETGCVFWAMETDAPVRTAVSIGPNGGGWAAYFGDQHAHVYAVDAVTGKLLWKTHVDEFPGAVITGAPALAAGRLYVPTSSMEEVFAGNPQYECCKFRGSVSALDAVTGKVLWKSYTVAEEPKPVRMSKIGVQLWGPSGAGVWSSPTVDRKTHTVYVTTGDSYSDPAAPTSDSFLALDLETGKRKWSQQMTKGDAFNVNCGAPEQMRPNCPEANGPDFDFGSSPILVDLGNGRRALIAGQKSGIVYALDPDKQGELLWERRVGRGGSAGGVQWGSATDAKNVYVAVSDVTMHPVPAGTPGARDTAFGFATQLDPKIGGGLFALKLDTGDIVWHTPHPGCGETSGCSPAQSAAVTAIPGVIFSGGLDGHLRAYSAQDGHIVWDVDTAKDYKTANGVKAQGGALDGPGAVIVGGMLYVNSGYAFLGAAPGNALLAFSVDSK